MINLPNSSKNKYSFSAEEGLDARFGAPGSRGIPNIHIPGKVSDTKNWEDVFKEGIRKRLGYAKLIKHNAREFVRLNIRKFPYIYNPAKRMYRVCVPLQTRGDHLVIQNCLKENLQDKDSIYFIQVGSNDGKQGDPLHHLIKSNRHWEGIFIEPVKFVFKRLVKNYRNSKRFIFENKAIAEKRKKIKFYYLSEKADYAIEGGLPWWYDQLGSFNKDHIQKHFANDVEPFIIEEDVNCVPLTEIMEQHDVDKLDLIHLDTEGYDYKILSQVDFEKYRPKCILYERKHLSKKENQKAENLLRRFGYKLTKFDVDNLAVLID